MNFSETSTLLAQMPPWGQTLAGLTVLLAIAVVANLLVKQVVIRLVEHGLRGFGLAAGGRYLDPVARRLSNIVPALVISAGIALVPHLPANIITIIRNVMSAFIVLAVVMTISAALDYANALYQRRPEAASRPIKGYIQVAKILLYGASAILIVAALMEQSPLLLLSGLGAMAAVLMLVFKDTILSLVASVQLTSNDMLRVGDWIEMPQLNADGDVIDIALHTVKVQNFDKTITTIPTYRLISDSFRNWRGMAESGGRRIMRSLYIDQNSVRFLTTDEQAALSRFALLRPYIERKREEIDRWNADAAREGQDPVNHRELTNIGTFRAYVQAYVESHPGIHHGMTLLVRQLAPRPEGLPIEIYGFTNTVAWADYEAIQGDIFDHLLAIMPHFDLRLFQQPGGMDLRQLPQPIGPAPFGEECERLRHA
jgi:miniconductance mechanosensitive channel